MKTIKFADELIDLILSGEKTTTFRLFDDKNLSEGDKLEFLRASDSKVFAHAKITKVYEKRLKDLSDEDYKGHEKYESAAQALETFRKYYGDSVAPETIVKIVRFKLL